MLYPNDAGLRAPPEDGKQGSPSQRLDERQRVGDSARNGAARPS